MKQKYIHFFARYFVITCTCLLNPLHDVWSNEPKQPELLCMHIDSQVKDVPHNDAIKMDINIDNEDNINDSVKICRWVAGETIKPSSIEKWGQKRAFKEYAIGQSLFKRIYKKSYKEDCNIRIEDLRYLTILHYNIKKEILLGELICHKDISADLLSIFQELFKNHYPIERMLLIDTYNANDESSMQANNTSCFNFRRIAGSKILSNHSTGHAIDINPLYNPYVKIRNGKVIYQPKTAGTYINRMKSFPYKINKEDLCYKLFKKHGFIWGGDWKSTKDYQHFEKKSR